MIEFTTLAAEHVRQIIEAENDPTILGLRIFVSGGGCSGFQYGFGLCEGEEEGDTIIETNGVKMYVDPMSMMYLDGSKVDYVSGLMGEQFVISNPNVTSTCGCGASFQV